MSSADDPLPPGWTTQKSRSTGRVYYCNLSTGQSTFDRNDPMIPKVAAKAPAPAPAPVPAAARPSAVVTPQKKPATSAASADDPLPPGWTTQKSRSTGRVYYCNLSTGQSTFDRNDPMIPKVAAKATKAPAPAPAPAAARPAAVVTPQKKPAAATSEAAVRRKFQAMTLTQLKKLCADSWLSQVGTREQVVARLVDYEKPAGGWPSASPGTPSASASASAPAAGAKQYTIKLAAKVRSGFEATSSDLGVAHVGEVITEIESRVNASGITRVRYDRGWLSKKTADGRVILEPYDPLPPGWTTQQSRSTGRMYYVNHSTGQSTFDRNDPMIPKMAAAPAPAPAPAPTVSTPTRPPPTGAGSASSGTQYEVKLMARVRSGFEQSSVDKGVAQIGDVITELESRVNASGIKRVRYERGWISAKTSDGRAILSIAPAYEDALPPGWTTQKSRSTGRTYYVNHSTGQSTFDRNDPMIPKVAAAPAPAPAPARAAGPTEGQVKGKYMAMTLMELRRACTQKGLSQIGSKEQLIAKLVEKEKPPGGWGGSHAPAAARVSGGGPTEGQVKGKYMAMTLMELRRSCSQKGLSQIGSKEQLIAKLVEKEKPRGGWGGIAAQAPHSAAAPQAGGGYPQQGQQQQQRRFVPQSASGAAQQQQQQQQYSGGYASAPSHSQPPPQYVEPNYHMPLPEPVKTVRTQMIVVGRMQRPWPTSLAWTRCVRAALSIHLQIIPCNAIPLPHCTLRYSTISSSHTGSSL
jgi:hypothetical protein